MGSLATFEATRYARGHKALFTLEVNGERASAIWDLHDLHRLEYFDYRDEGPLRGWKSIHITDGDHPYMKNWWVPGLQIGYEHTFIHQVADFVTSVGEGKPMSPTFRDGLATEYVTDAVLKSAQTRKWGDGYHRVIHDSPGGSHGITRSSEACSEGQRKVRRGCDRNDSGNGRTGGDDGATGDTAASRIAFCSSGSDCV